MTTPLASTRMCTELRTAESPYPSTSIENLTSAGTSPQKTSLLFRTPLSDASSLNGRVVKSPEKTTPATVRLDQLAPFTESPLTNCHTASSDAETTHILKTPLPKKIPRFPFPKTGLPSSKAGSRPLRSNSPCRRLVLDPSTLSPVLAVPQETLDPLFMGRVNYFLKGIPAIEANLRAERLIASINVCLEENQNDKASLATKILALIVLGKIADFGEVFYHAEPGIVDEMIEIYLHVLTKAETACKENPHNLVALIIKTGVLGFIGQYKQETSPEEPSEQDRTRDSHWQTLASAEKLLAHAPDHLTGIFMQIQALTFLERPKEVSEALNSAMEKYPNHAMLWTLLAMFCYYEDNLQEALEAITKAIEVEPDHFLLQAVRRRILDTIKECVPRD